MKYCRAPDNRSVQQLSEGHTPETGAGTCPGGSRLPLIQQPLCLPLAAVQAGAAAAHGFGDERCEASAAAPAGTFHTSLPAVGEYLCSPRPKRYRLVSCPTPQGSSEKECSLSRAVLQSTRDTGGHQTLRGLAAAGQ